jgi:Tfp pilus assembly protein PilO
MVLKNREKILIVFATIVIAIWAFDHFYYAPQSRNIQRLQAEVKAADLKLDESLMLAKGVDTLEAAVLRQEEEMKKFSERILRGEEFRTFLKHLARESDPVQMKVISLIPQEPKPLSLDEKKEASVSPYRRVTVQVVLHSTYAKLSSYLNRIEELPFLIHVDNLHVEKNEEGQPLLKITMELSMYIASL